VNPCSLSNGTGEAAYTCGVQHKRANRSKKRGAEAGEDGLLRKIEQALGGRGGRYGIRMGIGDDAAVWRPRSGFETILTCDWFLEGSHFLRDVHPPDAIGWKCLVRAASDIAAMGGEPRCFLLSLALPQSHAGEWLSGFLAGLKRASRRLDCVLAGGDTTRRREILVNVTVIGEVKTGRAVLRSGARRGDRIFVSGKLGEAELGLKLIGSDKRGDRQLSRAARKHLYPEPRLDLGRWLGEKRIATAMMDLSDGLSSDLVRLCRASRVGAKVQSAKIPLASKDFREEFRAPERLLAGLHGGDDYELLFCVAKSDAAKIPSRFSGVELTEIGEITSGRKIRLIEPSGRSRSLTAGGWDPFRKKIST
jgi:thiamine-monophosphate kinase